MVGDKMFLVYAYSRGRCPYCDRAVQILENRGAKFEVRVMDNNPVARELLATLAGATTLPQIYLDGKHLGGCSDLVQLEQDGLFDNISNGDRT